MAVVINSITDRANVRNDDLGLKQMARGIFKKKTENQIEIEE